MKCSFKRQIRYDIFNLVVSDYRERDSQFLPL